MNGGMKIAVTTRKKVERVNETLNAEKLLRDTLRTSVAATDHLDGAFEGLAVVFKRFTQDLVDEPIPEVDTPGVQSL